MKTVDVCVCAVDVDDGTPIPDLEKRLAEVVLLVPEEYRSTAYASIYDDNLVIFYTRPELPEESERARLNEEDLEKRVRYHDYMRLKKEFEP